MDKTANIQRLIDELKRLRQENAGLRNRVRELIAEKTVLAERNKVTPTGISAPKSPARPETKADMPPRVLFSLVLFLVVVLFVAVFVGWRLGQHQPVAIGQSDADWIEIDAGDTESPPPFLDEDSGGEIDDAPAEQPDISQIIACPPAAVVKKNSVASVLRRSAPVRPKAKPNSTELASTGLFYLPPPGPAVLKIRSRWLRMADTDSE